MKRSIIGYVDSVTSQTIDGWIANFENPHSLESVVCCGQNGVSLEFKAHIPRRDVCEAFSITGLFGFSIPVGSLASLGSVVHLTAVTGETLEGGENIMLPQTNDTPFEIHQIIIALHIQKTAGTSLRVALSSAYHPHESVFVYPDRRTGISPLELGEMPIHQKNGLKLVMGHMYFGIADYFAGPTRYITIIRHPVDRLRSHYLHHLRNSSDFVISGKSTPLQHVVQYGLTDEFDNLMTRVVAGVGTDSVPCGNITENHVDAALDNIRANFLFVGLTERLAAHYNDLSGLLNLSAPPLGFDNSAVDRFEADFIDWSDVGHRNRFDSLLYTKCLQHNLIGMVKK